MITRSKLGPIKSTVLLVTFAAALIAGQSVSAQGSDPVSPGNMGQPLPLERDSIEPDNTALLEYFQQRIEGVDDSSDDLETNLDESQLKSSMSELSKLYRKPDKASLGLAEPIPLATFDEPLRQPSKQQDSRSRGNLDGLRTITGIPEGKLSGFVGHSAPKTSRPSE